MPADPKAIAATLVDGTAAGLLAILMVEGALFAAGLWHSDLGSRRLVLQGEGRSESQPRKKQAAANQRADGQAQPSLMEREGPLEVGGRDHGVTTGEANEEGGVAGYAMADALLA